MNSDIKNLELVGWVGEDEQGSGVVGLKQGLMPCGMTPLVGIMAHSDKFTRPGLIQALQAQADYYGKTIYFVRFTAVEIVETLTPRHKQQ